MANWIENDAQWYEQRMVHCGCCGRLIAKHFLVSETPGEPQIFCSEGCEELFRDYVLTERGGDYERPEDVWAVYEQQMTQ